MSSTAAKIWGFRAETETYLPVKMTAETSAENATLVSSEEVPERTSARRPALLLPADCKGRQRRRG